MFFFRFFKTNKMTEDKNYQRADRAKSKLILKSKQIFHPGMSDEKLEVFPDAPPVRRKFNDKISFIYVRLTKYQLAQI